MQRFFIFMAVLCFFATPAFAGFEEGKKAYEKQDWVRAITELRPLAEAGDDRAMLLLGNMYSEGYGVMRSYKEALSLYKRAAVEKNNAEAMLAMGAMYTSGRGVEARLNTAKEWFLRAAELGSQQAAFFYATVLFQGNKSATDDIQPDAYQSYKWFRIAEKEPPAGHFQQAAKQIADLIAEKRLKAEDVLKADKEAAAWKPVTAESLGPPPEGPVTTTPSPGSPETPQALPGQSPK